MDVRRFIDLHVHVGPEVIPRKYTASQLVKEEAGKIAGVALKNHFCPTAPLIRGVESEDIILVGSVTLNNYVGGLNPDAVYASAKISKLPIIVWFPTINARNFLERSEYEIPPEWVGPDFRSRPSKEVKGISAMDAKGKLTEDAEKVLQAIKDNDCILATGHVSWQEARYLVTEAVRMGIKRIIVTHPIYQLIDMPLEVQKELSQNEGVYIEQTFAMYSIDRIPISRIAEQIKAIGVENCIISSDVGQVNSPSPSEALSRFTKMLLKEGLTEDDLRMMGGVNPRKLLAK